MEVMPRRDFEASVAGKLRLWSSALHELERQLPSSTPGRRRQILSEMIKLGSKRRAAVITLREIKLREQRLAYRREGRAWP